MEANNDRTNYIDDLNPRKMNTDADLIPENQRVVRNRHDIGKIVVCFYWISICSSIG